METETSTVFDTTERDKQLMNIRFVVEGLMEIFEHDTAAHDAKSPIINLDQSNAYSGFLSTVYSYWRKNNNADSSQRGNDHATATCTYGNVVFSVKEVADKIMKLKPQISWDFKLATPLVDVLTAFRMTWDECRLSAARFRLKLNGQNVEKGITAFGLTNVHLPLLTGLTYKPERRAGLLRTLGPLTLAIALSAEKKMHDKLLKAFKESIRMLPMGESIAECLRDASSPDECRSLFCSLGDLLLCLGSRSSNKIYFPLLFFCKAWAPGMEIDFSGIKGFKFYNKQAPRFKWLKKSDMGTTKLSQIVFHSMFGTSTEDLGVLGQITSHSEWNTRKELDAVFTKKLNKDEHFTPILFKYISKLASASMTKGGATAQPMLINKIVFAGTRKRSFSSAFLNYLESGSRQITYGRDVASLSAALVRYKESIVTKMRSGNFDMAGTAIWHNMDGEEVKDLVVSETGRFFYS